MIPVVGLGAGVEVPALCLAEGPCTSSAVIMKFLAGETGLASGLHVPRATQRDPDKPERLSFLFLYMYLMYFLLSCLEANASTGSTESSWCDGTLLPELQQTA